MTATLSIVQDTGLAVLFATVFVFCGYRMGIDHTRKAYRERWADVAKQAHITEALVVRARESGAVSPEVADAWLWLAGGLIEATEP